VDTARLTGRIDEPTGASNVNADRSVPTTAESVTCSESMFTRGVAMAQLIVVDEVHAVVLHA
jgi:hypothetical protein